MLCYGGRPRLEALDDVAANAPSGHSAHSLPLEVVGVLSQLWNVPLSIDSLQILSQCQWGACKHACIGSASQRQATLRVFTMRPVTSSHTALPSRPMPWPAPWLAPTCLNLHREAARAWGPSFWLHMRQGCLHRFSQECMEPQPADLLSSELACVHNLCGRLCRSLSPACSLPQGPESGRGHGHMHAGPAPGHRLERLLAGPHAELGPLARNAHLFVALNKVADEE